MYQIALGHLYSLILNGDGSVWCSGSLVKVPKGMDGHFVKVIASGGVAVSAGYSHGLVLKQDGSIWGAGRNSRGQIGDGSKDKRDSFTFAQKIPGAITVAAGGSHSMVLTREGRVWTAGSNLFGQMGKSKENIYFVYYGREGTVFMLYSFDWSQ